MCCHFPSPIVALPMAKEKIPETLNVGERMKSHQTTQFNFFF